MSTGLPGGSVQLNINSGTKMQNNRLKGKENFILMDGTVHKEFVQNWFGGHSHPVFRDPSGSPLFFAVPGTLPGWHDTSAS